MKRANDELGRSGEGRKRVRFDPSTKDNSSTDSVPTPTAAPKVPRRPRSEDDNLDILGRRIEEKAGSSDLIDEITTQDFINKKHTLDSDEEDEKYEPRRLDIKSVQGQEKATIEYDGSTKIMPFNMNEEMEEGHYDDEGNYVFNKETDDIRDEWLDNLDWDSVKLKAGTHWNKMTDGNDEDEQKGAVQIDGIKACERILRYLDDQTLIKNDNVTINDVLKKLNSQKNLSAAEERKKRWEAKKKGVEYKNDFSEAANDLTGAADDLISLGHMETYSMHRQQIFDLYEKLEVAKELAERAERRKLAEAQAKAKEEEDKLDSTENLIKDLISDDEMEADEASKLDSLDHEVEVSANT